MEAQILVGLALESVMTLKKGVATCFMVVIQMGSLQSLELVDFPVLAFRSDLQGWTTLRRLRIRNCDALKKSLPNDRKCLSFMEYVDVDFWKNDPILEGSSSQNHP